MLHNFTFVASQRCLDMALSRIFESLEHATYKRQLSRIVFKCDILRSVFPLLDESTQRCTVQSLDELSSNLHYWSSASILDVVLHMPADLSILEEFITNKCQKSGISVSIDRNLDADNDWQDGLAFVRQMLRWNIFVEDSMKLRGVEGQTMMHIMQSVLDNTRSTDSCRHGAFRILNMLCEIYHTFKPAGVPVLTIRSDSDSVASRGSRLIYKGCLASGQLIAAKSTLAFTNGVSGTEIEKQFLHEVLLWYQLSHPFILPLLGVTDHGTSPDMTRTISPWCHNGNISQYLRHPGAANVNRLQLLYEVCVGLLYLHDHVPCVIHGNLKCANVLIQDDGSPCLSDFGFAPLEACNISSFLHTLKGGGLRWMSVERLCSEDAEAYRRATLRKESDLWSLGMLVLEAFTGKHPYHTLPANLDVITTIVQGGRPSQPTEWKVVRYGLDNELWQLLSGCWEADPESRPTLLYFVSVIRRLAGSWSNRFVSST